MVDVQATSRSAQEGEDAQIGRLVAGRYLIERPLGRGGMGQVYRALQQPIGRPIALKLLPSSVRDPGLQRRFLLEASVTGRLTHPNTVTIFDHGRADDGTFFIAMELLEGATLLQLLQQELWFAQERAVHVAQQICRSLREAHAMGIVHRDLKPANVFLLRQQDDHDFVKVLDFGLLKFFGGGGEQDEPGGLTNPGLFMGTPHYMAPEQARNQPLDQRADVYSLGVVLFQMLTGRVPFVGPSSMDVLLQHVQADPPLPREIRPEIDPSLEAVVLRCLRKQREDRFETMDALLAELKLVKKLLTGRDGPPSLPPPRGPNSSGEGLALATPALPMPALRRDQLEGAPAVLRVAHNAASARPARSSAASLPPPAPPPFGGAVVKASPPSPAVSRAQGARRAAPFAAIAEPQAEGSAAGKIGLLIAAAASAAIFGIFYFRARPPVALPQPSARAASQAPAAKEPRAPRSPPATLESRPVEIAGTRPPRAKPVVKEQAARSPAPPRAVAAVALSRTSPAPAARPAVFVAEAAPAPAVAASAVTGATAAAPALEGAALASPVVAAPSPAIGAARPAVRNVPAFVLQREVLSQAPLRFSDIFRQSHKGRGQAVGLYKLCVGTDGRVASVQVMQGVGGDSEVVEGIRESWVYKPQAQPVCAMVQVPVLVR